MLLNGQESFDIKYSHLTTKAWYELNTKGVVSDTKTLLQLAGEMMQRSKTQ